MKIIICGCKGQLGNELLDIIHKGHSEIGDIDTAYKTADVKGVDIDELDIGKQKMVMDYFEKSRPDIFINCAAYTNVDKCEDERELAFQVNALGARNLAQACHAYGVKLVQVSTDYVFSGEGDVPFCEYDMCAPKSVYGSSKLLGEYYTREFCNKYFIVRTAWLYGKVGHNFVKTILRIANEKKSIQVVNDQFGNPTNANDLAHHILKMVLTQEYGVYHCTNEGVCSWFDFASEIVRLAKIDCKVQHVSSEEYVTKAKRPAYSALENMMLKVTCGNEMREWKEALYSYLK